MTSAQVGKTEVLNNIIGYFIDQDPSPMLMIQPTLEMGMAWSKDRFAPMVRDTKELYERVSDVKAKDGGNTILHKTFPGGHITVAGANSPASLASRPVRVVLFDEVDKYPASAGTEGDPVKLGSKRTQTFWNRKEILTSTPTIKGISRIEHSYLSSDMRYYCVPCPKCSHFQKLMFKGLKWDKTESGYDMQSVHYECENCKEKLYEADKYRMVKKGEWRKTNPEQRTHAGFHISELYSPWSTWKQIVEDFLEAKKRPETLKVWQNTTLGESVEEEESFTISDEKLAARIEHYEVVPSGVLLLTCGIDIQEDRIELVVKGWGKADESWFIERRIFYGTTEALDTFKPLAEYLVSEFKHESGVSLKIVSVCIDSGFRSTVVYQFVKSMQSKVKYIFAVKGFGGYGRKFIGKVTNNNKYYARFLPLGVDEAKTTIYNRLAIDEPGTGYMHFNAKCDQDYFDQLTSEKHITKYSKGFPTRVWLLKKGKRNEMLDVEVYNLAAYTMLNANMEKVEAHFQSKVDRVEVKTDETPKEIDPAPRVRRNIPRKNFVTSW